MVRAGVHEAQREEAAFRREGERLVVLWAERFSESREDASALVRRLAGEPDARAAGFTDARGRERQRAGGPLPPLPRPAPEEARTVRVGPSDWAHWAPVREDGRRTGFVVWVRDGEPARRAAARRARGWGGAVLWWVVAGAAGTLALGRRLARSMLPPISSPLDKFPIRG